MYIISLAEQWSVLPIYINYQTNREKKVHLIENIYGRNLTQIIASIYKKNMLWKVSQSEIFFSLSVCHELLILVTFYLPSLL